MSQDHILANYVHNSNKHKTNTEDYNALVRQSKVYSLRARPHGIWVALREYCARPHGIWVALRLACVRAI